MNESSHTAQAELEQARRELRSLAARLNGILDAAVDGLIVIDDRAIVESFNPSAERIFGYRAEEVLGRNVAMLMPQPYRREHDGYVEKYLRTGQAKIIGIGREVTGLRRDVPGRRRADHRAGRATFCRYHSRHHPSQGNRSQPA